MKTRNGYVSNSSSSSFILAKDPAFDGITRDDLFGAIKSVYPSYDERLESSRKMCEKYDFEYTEETLPPFTVYDVSDKAGHDKAVETWGELLDDWISALSIRGKDGKCLIDGDKVFEAKDKWGDFTERLEDKKDEDGWKVSVSGYNTLGSIVSENDRGEGMYRYGADGKCQFSRMPDKTLKKIQRKWKSLGLVSNRELLDDPEARFLVHFGENDIHGTDGMTSDDRKYCTESYTYERFIEILVGALKKAGKLPADYDYKEMLKRTMTVCMHEG